MIERLQVTNSNGEDQVVHSKLLADSLGSVPNSAMGLAVPWQQDNNRPGDIPCEIAQSKDYSADRSGLRDILWPGETTPEWKYDSLDDSWLRDALWPGETTPKKHKLRSRVFSLGTKLDITDRWGNSEGVIEQKVVSLTTTFRHEDKHGQLIATARQKLLSWGTQIEISNSDGNRIATIKEQVLKSLLRPYSVYSILDGDGREIASSGKVQLFATTFTLRDKHGHAVATIHRPALQLLRDNWDLTIKKPGVVPDSVLFMIPAYKTAADARR